MATSRSWFRSADAPLRVFCKAPDCFHTYYLVASAIPGACPGCGRESTSTATWWTINRPAGKPVKGVLSENDRRFLRAIKIQYWDGGIDT